MYDIIGYHNILYVCSCMKLLVIIIYLIFLVYILSTFHVCHFNIICIQNDVYVASGFPTRIFLTKTTFSTFLTVFKDSLQLVYNTK